MALRRRCPATEGPPPGFHPPGKESESKMSTDKTISRRFEQTRKTYGTQLYNLYQYWEAFRDFAESDDDLPTLEDVQNTPDLFDGTAGGGTPVDDLIGAYFLMHQAWRDEMAGCAMHDQPIDKLIEAFDAWNQPTWD
jgi:hypothetical protein